MGWDLCVGWLYEHRFAVLIILLSRRLNVEFEELRKILYTDAEFVIRNILYTDVEFVIPE